MGRKELDLTNKTKNSILSIMNIEDRPHNRYILAKKTNRSYSTIYEEVKSLERKLYIKKVTKNEYIITKKGRTLLSLFKDYMYHKNKMELIREKYECYQRHGKETLIEERNKWLSENRPEPLKKANEIMEEE